MDENDEKQLRRELGKRLREARQGAAAGHRYTQGEVATALGKKVAAISAWETGRTLPDALAVRWMGQHYGVSADVLLALKPALPGEGPAPAPVPAAAGEPSQDTEEAAFHSQRVAIAKVNASEVPGSDSIELPLQDFVRVLDRALGSGLSGEREKHAFIEGVLAAYQVKSPPQR
ncbi:helix-turn-helix domain-containing protein [Azohydromonas caseinilytica]|uniref:Helix-turn-helix domain-containing protein n=1 Tax=Azohydromonas caseinilytica TaxID=2728836 RepID=A0A848FFE6_9BURK|nr:helix-turn-helix transcriptional regulator [Azohydromonas caseinilytica]NML16983.1 helix-turn-helix domain-containing protein [Azohydromonas caseinilytica]